MQPDLTLRYDSSGGNGWLGLGWDLNLGEISVDTRWGVPRYDGTYETETYALDGAVLSPTAIRSEGDFEGRVVERADFTRRVEDQYDLIIRHGDKPSNYWWDVRTKMGGIKWYGGRPDEGGPTGAATIEVLDETTPDPDDTRDKMLPGLGGSLDPTAVLRTSDDENAPIYRWALAAERDVGVNMMRYYYDRVTGKRVGVQQKTLGSQLYLKEVRYTATSNVGGRDTDPIEDPAYQVLLLRDGAPGTPPGAVRKDVIVDARGGFIQVTSDLLRRVEVRYGDPPAPCTVAEGPDCLGHKRNYNQLFRAYNLLYDEGPFGKSLLKAVDQIGSDGVRFATNAFEYYDDMKSGGFTKVEGGYDSQNDNLGQSLLGPVETSALGSSRTFGGDVHAYLGFALTPLKIVSVGASLTVDGGATEAMTEMLDLNGDGLPDKVFKDGGGVRYRPNQSGPSGGTTFGDDEAVEGLDRLSLEWNIGVSGAAEAHAGVGIQFSVGGDVTVGEDYFADVNNDGLVDLVSAGRVFFNHLEKRDGRLVPVFEDDSSRTLVPIDSAPLDLSGLGDIDKLKEVEDRQREQSPLQDTVRMWIPPFNGVVAITGAVTFDPPPDTRIGAPAYDGDGLRVTIQQGQIEWWATQLLTPGQSATPSNVGQLPVQKDVPIYFRLQSINDGRRDQVRWDPVIQYLDPSTGLALPARFDADGLDVFRYQASKDFTLAGRPSSVRFPLDGRVRVAGVVHKSKVTTDDITVWVEHNGAPVTLTPPVLMANFVGDVPVSLEFDVLGARGDDEDDMDTASLKLKVDSPIDVSAVTWTNGTGDDGPELYYLTATDPDGKPVQTRHPVDNTPLLQLHPLYTTDMYSANTLDAPQGFLVPDDGDPNHNEKITIDVDADVVVPHGGVPEAFPAEVVFTVKGGPEGLACKSKATFVYVAPPAPGLPDPGSSFADVGCIAEVTENQRYFFDITTSNVRFARLVDAHYDVEVDGYGDVPFARNWPAEPIPKVDLVTVFPEHFRGWASAGYNGDGARATAKINPLAFVLDRDNFPGDEEEPDGHFEDGRYEDDDFEDPIKKGTAYPFIPWHLKLTDAQGKVVGTTPSWRGPKDNIVVTPDSARSSRAGADDPRLVQPGVTVSGGDGVSAVRRVGVTAPSLGIVADVAGIVSGSFAAAPSFGLLDYMDMNGDGFPDVVAPGYIKYTGPRGAYTDGNGGGVGVVGRDISFSIGAGFSGSALDIEGNSKGDVGSGGTAPTSGPSGTPGRTERPPRAAAPAACKPARRSAPASTWRRRSPTRRTPRAWAESSQTLMSASRKGWWTSTVTACPTRSSPASGVSRSG